MLSLINNTLESKGVFDKAKVKITSDYLRLFVYHCVSKNHNRMVLRYLLYLVERKVYKTVEYIFVAFGHTKRFFDRLFK